MDTICFVLETVETTNMCDYVADKTVLHITQNEKHALQILSSLVPLTEEEGDPGSSEWQRKQVTYAIQKIAIGDRLSYQYDEHVILLPDVGRGGG